MSVQVPVNSQVDIAQAQLLFDYLDVDGDRQVSLQEFKSLYLSKQLVAPEASQQHIQEPSQFIQESATYVKQQGTPPCMPDSQIPYEPPVFLQHSGTYSANVGEVATYSTPPVPDAHGVATSSPTHPVSYSLNVGEVTTYSAPPSVLQSPSSSVTCVTAAPAVTPRHQASLQSSYLTLPPQQPAPYSVPRPFLPTIPSVGTRTKTNAQTSFAVSSFPQPSAQAITGGMAPPQMVPPQTASAQMAPQPQRMGSGVFPRKVAAPVITYEGPSLLQTAPPHMAQETQQMAPQQMGPGMFSQGVVAPGMTYEAPASQVSSPRQVPPPQTAPLQMAPQPQQMAPQEISCGMFSQGAATAVMTYEAPVSQVISPPQMAPLQKMSPHMAPQPQQTAPQRAGSGRFSQGAASVMTYEAPRSQVPCPRVNSRALHADNFTVGGRDTAKDDATRNKFKKQVMEAVSHCEEMITIPTKMAIGLLEMGLPESDRADLKPLKVAKSRRWGACCGCEVVILNANPEPIIVF